MRNNAVVAATKHSGGRTGIGSAKTIPAPPDDAIGIIGDVLVTKHAVPCFAKCAPKTIRLYA